MTRIALYLLALLCLASPSDDPYLATNQNDFVVKMQIETELHKFKIESLNTYMEQLVQDGCEILYAEKDEKMLILVFEDPRGRVIANTNGIQQNRISWGSEEEEVAIPDKKIGLSYIEITYPKLINNTIRARATARLPQGVVFYPSKQNLGKKIRLNLLLDGKKYRSITCHLAPKKVPMNKKEEKERERKKKGDAADAAH